MVTGKNKERFEEWYVRDFILRDENRALNVFGLKLFYKSPIEYQKGVYEAYYMDNEIEVIVKSWKQGDSVIFFKTRKEAFTQALKEADKLMNKEL